MQLPDPTFFREDPEDEDHQPRHHGTQAARPDSTAQEYPMGGEVPPEPGRMGWEAVDSYC